MTKTEAIERLEVEIQAKQWDVDSLMERAAVKTIGKAKREELQMRLDEKEKDIKALKVAVELMRAVVLLAKP